MGIVLGLATALCWGSADLFARYATRRIGTFRTMLYMQGVGWVLLTAVMPLLGGWGHLVDGSGWRPWAWGILAGLLNTTSTLALYRSFEVGKLSVVAPVSASYPALTMLLAVLSGERLTAARFFGIVLIIVGVVLVARGEVTAAEAQTTSAGSTDEKRRAGVGWALLSAAGFGVMFWLLGLRIVPALGSAPSVWMIRSTSFVTTIVVMLITAKAITPPAIKVSPLLLAVGILDTSAWVFNNFGMLREQVSVVSVLASLYGAVTVGLAAIFLRERVSRMQWMGIAAVFLGISLISR